MKKVLCEKNHYYDADRYDTCPHCARARAFSEKMGQPQPTAPQEGRAPVMYWSVEQLRGRESVTPEQCAVQQEELDMRTMALLEPIETVFAAPQTQAALRGSDVPSEMTAVSPQEPEAVTEESETAVEEPELPEEPKVPAEEPIKLPEEPEDSAEAPTELAGKPVDFLEEPEAPAEEPIEPPEEPTELSKEPQAPAEALTELPEKPEIPAEEPPVPVMPPVLPLERTVGWLVCVKGARAGESFPLLCGRNLIGGGAQMDVRLNFDPEVTQDAQCVLTFDPETEAYYIQCGESRGLSYRNGALLLMPERLGANDTIRLGKTTLVFVPLITDSFRWQDYLDGAVK